LARLADRGVEHLKETSQEVAKWKKTKANPPQWILKPM
jgi:hypothetical protein